MMVKALDIEGAIVATLLKKPELLAELRVKPEMFTDSAYQNFITHVKEKAEVDLHDLYIKSAKDPTFVNNEKLSDLYNSEFVGVGYFKRLEDDIIHQFQKRESYRILNLYQQDESIKIRNLVEDLQELEKLETDQEENTRAYVNELIDELYSDEPLSKVQTKFGLLDYKIGGFEPSQLIVIAARPSMGKTAFALNLMWNIATQGYQTSFFSLETTGKNILQRILTSICKIDLSKIKEVHDLTVEEISELINGLDKIMENNINIVAKSSITTQDIRAQAMKQSQKPQVIFIDYLQLMKTDIKADRRVAIENISRELKVIANETGAIIVILSQLNRNVEQRQDKRPMLSDMKESGGIEADASIAMMLYRDDYYDYELEMESGQSKVEVNIAKNKDGETGVMEFDFYKKIQRFYA